MADRLKKEGKTNIQKIKYLKNEHSFLDEIKNIFHSFWKAIIWWGKNSIKNNRQKLWLLHLQINFFLIFWWLIDCLMNNWLPIAVWIEEKVLLTFLSYFIPSCYLLVPSQQWKLQKNKWNLFKFNKKTS